MAAGVTVTFKNDITIDEIMGLNTVSSLEANRHIIHDQMNKEQTLNANSTPAAAKCACFQVDLVKDADPATTYSADINLRALAGSNNGPIDGNGLHVTAIKIIGVATNTAPIAITPGAQNGYALDGADYKYNVQAGEDRNLLLPSAQAIDATHKIIHLACAAAGSLKMAIVLG